MRQNVVTTHSYGNAHRLQLAFNYVVINEDFLLPQAIPAVGAKAYIRKVDHAAIL